MDTLIGEIALTVGVPTVGFAMLSATSRRWLCAGTGPVADAIWFALSFAGGQMKILGAGPWPLADSGHALVGLAFVGVWGAALPSRRLVAGFIVLNVGLYCLFRPLVAEFALSVVLQWGLAQALFGLLFGVARRRYPGRGLVLAAFAAAFGWVILNTGSTTLAMTAWLLAGLTAGRWVASRWARTAPGHPDLGSADDASLWPAFVVLFGFELYNYVL